MQVQARLIGFAVVVTAVGIASAQFGGFGGFGKGTKGDYFTLVNNPGVRNEIKITEAQIAKLPAAAIKALSDVLDESQVKRLKQISLQQKDYAAFVEADVKKELKITDDQAKKIKAAMDKQAQEQAELFKEGFNPERNQEIAAAAKEAAHGVLTAAQKTAWTKMVGEPYEFKGGFGFGKKKND